jgi:hypothetical protein
MSRDIYGNPLERFHDATCRRYVGMKGLKCVPQRGYVEVLQEVQNGKGVTRTTLAHVLPTGSGIVLKMPPTAA